MTTGAPSGRLLPAKAAAAYLGVPYTTLRYWAKRGLVPVVRPPGAACLLFDRKDLDGAIERWKEHALERWQDRLANLETARVQRRQARQPDATPASAKPGRSRKGVSRPTTTAYQESASRLPPLFPPGNGADR